MKFDLRLRKPLVVVLDQVGLVHLSGTSSTSQAIREGEAMNQPNEGNMIQAGEGQN